MRANALLLAAALLLGACGDEQSRPAAAAPPAPVADPKFPDAGPTPAARRVAVGGGELTQPFRSDDFTPAFSLRLPRGWTALDRGDDLVQVWIGEDELHSPGEITIGVAPGSPSATLRRFAATPALRVLARGRDEVTASATRRGELADGYRLFAGARVRMQARRVGGRTVWFLVDAFPADAAAFAREADRVLATFRAPGG